MREVSSQAWCSVNTWIQKEYMGGVGSQGEKKMEGVGTGREVGRKEMEVRGLGLREREI
jgi:hypothetical protein